MEQKQPIKKTTSKTQNVSTVSIRVKQETKKKLLQEVSKCNKKQYGKKIRPDDYLALAILLITPEHVKDLQTASLSNSDRMEIKYREYISQHGSISKDAFIGRLLRGEIHQNNAINN